MNKKELHTRDHGKSCVHLSGVCTFRRLPDIGWYTVYQWPSGHHTMALLISNLKARNEVADG
jgi:hypothetical protein